ncbi:MAG: AAA family ATPase [Acetobacteraceae bacterium]|nr:AAA family ATPase [Acetobacteraceae bacterium]
MRGQLADLERAAAAETGRVVAATEAEVRAARGRIGALEQSLNEARAQVDRSARSQIPLNVMERDAEAARSLLRAALERLQQTAQQAAIEIPDARIVSSALPPDRPSSPKTLLLMAAASAFGICFGLLLVYLLETMDGTFRSGQEIRAILGLRCLALVPELRRAVTRRIRIQDYVAEKPLSPFAEQLRVLRAGLWVGAETPRVVAITAARPSEGKTTMAITLGRSAALNGERVIVLDCDVRQPSFGRLMQADGALGIADCLLGHAELEQVIQQDPLSGMNFIPAGSAETGSLALFMSETMGTMLDRLRHDYELVLLDAPPAFAMADARIIARLADATLLCVRWRDTPQSVVRNSLDLLEETRAKVVGIVMTRVDPRAHGRSGFADAEVYHSRHGGYFRE